MTLITITEKKDALTSTQTRQRDISSGAFLSSF